VLYVNNIRAYYNIISWLTENEEQPIDVLDEDTDDGSDLIARVTVPADSIAAEVAPSE
jgi:hypothetical protein